MSELLKTKDDSQFIHLQEIIERRTLTPLFQPIIDMAKGEIAGYEGLIRGPSNSPLHAPLNLFRAASTYGLSVKVEHLCRRIVLEQFMRAKLPGKLFLNVSPECLLHRDVKHGETLGYIESLGLSPKRVIIELTESQPTLDYEVLREAVMHYRKMGFEIAIDDLGEGFSSLRLWSELRPDYVKIDMHFIQGINQDPVKLQFVKSIQEIARNSNSQVVAEGIETEAELRVVKDLGIAFGQGYFIAHPHAQPSTILTARVTKSLNRRNSSLYTKNANDNASLTFTTVTAAKLMHPNPQLDSSSTNDAAFNLFHQFPDLQSIPVVDNGLPVGIINRQITIERYAHRYWPEIHGKRACKSLTDTQPVVVDKNTSVQELSRIMVEAKHRHLANGFIVTEEGKYLGIGSAHELMSEITQQQIAAARYANPLTQLPGNVPINEHVERLLFANQEFTACYADLDHFKPFNDVYGYRKGDDVIYLTSRILVAHCDSKLDFIGHIGGDDFIIIFQSNDWELRCKTILTEFSDTIKNLFSIEDRENGGYVTEDRQGRKIFCPLVSLSLAAISIKKNECTSQHLISEALANAKKQSKKMPGNSLFIERRQAI